MIDDPSAGMPVQLQQSPFSLLDSNVALEQESLRDRPHRNRLSPTGFLGQAVGSADPNVKHICVHQRPAIPSNPFPSHE